MTPFLTKQEIEKKRKAREAANSNIKKEQGETDKAFMERLLNNAPAVKTIQVPRQKKFTGVPEVSVGGVVEKQIKKKEEKKILPNKNIVEEEPVERTITEEVLQPGEERIPGFKHFVTDIIDSNEIYQMQDDFFGAEYGEPIAKKENLDTYEEVLSNPDIVAKLRDRAVSNFKQLHPNERVDDYAVDIMVQDVVKNRIAQEKQDKQTEDNLFIKQSRANNNYMPTLTAGINQHIKEVDPMEQAIASNIKMARSLQKIMDDANAPYEKKNKAALELEKLGATLESQLKDYDEDYTYMFDNKTGRRLSKAEVNTRQNTGETGTMSNREAEIKAMKALHKDQDLESLERGYFTHVNRYNNFNNRLNQTYDINPNDIVLRNTLAARGYKFKPGTNTFTGVKIKDIMPFLDSDRYNKSIEEAFANATPTGKGAEVRGAMVPYLKDLVKEKAKLGVEREAYKTSYLMNIDPKSLKQTALGTVGRFAEAATEATIGDELTRKIGVTERKQLDEIEKVFTDAGIAPSKEQKEAFKRSTSMKVAEGAGSFIPELVKFAAVNAVTGGILGTTGFGARVAALGRSKNITDRILHLGFNALKEEVTFKTATLGESQTGGGAGFYLGGAAMNKLMPFRFAGSMARFNPFIEKVVLAGPGMVAGSEAAAFTEAAYKDMTGKESFKKSMEDLYGEDSEWADRMVVNAWVGGLIGGLHLKGNDLKSMSEKRAMFDNTYNEIIALEQENKPANKRKIEQKKNALALLDREIQVADRNFISQDIGSLKKQMNEAQSQIDSGKLNDKELVEAEDQVAKGQAHIAAVKRNIERDFKAASMKGAFADGVSLNILDGKTDAEGNVKIAEKNKAEYDPVTNTINIDINQYKKGVLGHEAGHSMMKAAFKNNPEIAEKFKQTIKDKVENAFSGIRFNDGKTFEEAINEAYGENQPAEEYVMNVMEFIQNPKYRDVLLSNKLLPTLKRAVGELGNKIGIDLTSNKPLELGEKNLNRASDLLEFLYDLGNAAEGKSSSALKNKFEKFKNITIDGNKLIDLKTGSELNTESKELSDIESMASKDISENEKKDIFSKVTRAYEDTMKAGGTAEVAGLMVGYEMEPLVKKQVEGYLTSKGITMSRDQVEDIVSSITTDSGPGTFGVPNLVEAWSKGQRLIEYIKTEKPSREAINNKAKELNIQDRTSAGSESSTIDKYIKMAEGNTEQAQLTSYIFGNLPKRILQTLQKSEFADSFNTFSIENVKNIDKLEESVGLSGASSSSEQGYIDVSSPEQYTRSSQKNAETILELPESLVEKINTDAGKFLNSQKLQDLDAKSIGTVPLKDGGKAKVAMLESDKARITYPDGRVETIKARSPKIVEQYVGAPDKSFEKDFNFKEGLAEGFKNSLFNELSKHAGNIIDNKKATPEYEKFIDNAFPLFKDYISQSAVNKRFAEFKEPFIDKATGKQAREKTAAGNPIFTKKNVSLAEWRKYFLGDGTQRIDGKRRSIIDALATELGFDATMNVLGKEAMRNQVESRQGELSVELLDNYVAVIAKQLDRNSPNSMASKIIEEVARKFNLTKEEATNRLRSVIYDNEGKIKPIEIIVKDPIGETFYNEVGNFAERDYRKSFDVIIANERVNTDTKQKLIEKGIDPKEVDIKEFVDIEKLSPKRITEYNDFIKTFTKGMPAEVKELTTAASARVDNSVLSQMFSYTGRPSKTTRYNFSRENFEKIIKDIDFDGKYSGITKKTYNQFKKWVEDVKKYNTKGKGITIKKNLSEYLMRADATSRLPSLDAKQKKDIIMNEIDGRKEAIIDLNLKSRFLGIILKVAQEKITKVSKPKDREKFARNFAVMLLNNDGVGMRSLSSEKWIDLTMPFDAEIKNEHLMAKAEFAAEVLKNLMDGTLSDAKIAELVDSYQSLLGNKQGQLATDTWIGRTPKDVFYLKLGLPQLLNIGLESKPKEVLENVLDWTTGKTAWETLIDSKIMEELPRSMASKELRELDKDLVIYHGAPEGKNVTKIGDKGVRFFATEKREADEYARMNSGKTQKFFVKESQLVDESVIIEKIKELDLKPKNKDFNVDEVSFYELIDPRFEESLSKPDIDKLFKELKDSGIKAISYTDGAQVSGKYTTSIAVIDPSVISKTETITSMASKDLSKDLSEMIERKKGLPAGEEISAAKASILGRKKGNFDFFIPPNAEDFAGMLYKFYGKGKQGDADMALMKEALLDPFERGENALSTYRQKLTTDLKAMDDQLNELGGKVTKESKEALKKSGFDADQATRVYIWDKKGVEIPDITQNEVNELVNIVENDARLRSYADGVRSLVDFPDPTDSWYGSNLKYDLYKYSTEGVRKDFLAEWKENMDAMFTKENYIRMEAAYGKGFVDNFKSLTKRMETGKFRPENINKAAQKGLDWINGSVGVIMWMNMRSALLQTTSAINYVNWGDNNILAAGKTLAKPVEFAKTFKELINSDFLKQRRNGLEINIEDAEIAKAIEKGGNTAQRLFGQLIKAGFKPTQMADSFSIAVGGTPFYMNRTKTYEKEVIIDSNGNKVRKYTDAQAKQKAFDDFRALSEEHQQSSRQDRVSNVQLGVLGRLIFAFNNTQMQMARLQKKATLDIINKRGDAKTNVSKLVYYGVLQSAIFTALQQGAFGLAFGKDDEELKEGEAEHIAQKRKDKAISMLNSMIDGTLNGIGLAGKLVTTAKNTLLKYQDESAKGYKANYGKVVNEALSISPPLSSKTKKVAKALEDMKRLSTKKGQKEVEESGAFNNPYNMPRAQLIAAATNLPIDRVLTKLDNLITAIDDENIQGWQRAALSLGWDKYSLGMYEDEYLDPTEQKEADAKEKAEKAAEAKATRDAKKSLEQAEYDALPQVTKDSLDLVKIKAKEKKSRDKYIQEQVRKSKLTPEQIEYEKYLAKEKRKKAKEKAKATKLRNQKIKDSINYANTRR
jgi:hypothetical protein